MCWFGFLEERLRRSGAAGAWQLLTIVSVTLEDLGFYLASSVLPKPQECSAGLGQGGDNLQHALIPTTTTTAQSSFPLTSLFSEGSVAVCLLFRHQGLMFFTFLAKDRKVLLAH